MEKAETEMTKIDKTHETFLAYTAEKMDDPGAVERFQSLKNRCETQLAGRTDASQVRVLDIGCGMGVQARIWSKDGYHVTALDRDPGLLNAGEKRAVADGLNIDWVCASADSVPLESGSFDFCLAVELLEHVPNWEECLSEFCRVIRPGGTLLVTTTNAICPTQNEFRLPLYSWWPGFMKRRAERLAVTTKPELANHTAWPAVNWFTYWSLKRALNKHSMRVRDRWDLVDLSQKPFPVKLLVKAARALPPLRAFLYLFTRGTIIFAQRVES